MDFRNILRRLFLWNRPHVYRDAEMTGARLAVGSYKSPRHEKSADAESARTLLKSMMLSTSDYQQSTLRCVSSNSLIQIEQRCATTKDHSERPKLRLIKSQKADTSAK